MTTKQTLDESIEEAGLELLAASKLEGQVFVNVGPCLASELRRYNWPKTMHWGKYDETILIEVYPDGDFSVWKGVKFVD